MQVIKHHPSVNYDPFLDWKKSWGHLSLYQVETMHQAGTSNNFSIQLPVWYIQVSNECKCTNLHFVFEKCESHSIDLYKQLNREKEERTYNQSFLRHKFLCIKINYFNPLTLRSDLYLTSPSDAKSLSCKQALRTDQFIS